MCDLDHTLPECPVARFLTVLDGPWATLIVRDLLTGPKRFTELRTGLPGISPKTLSSRLQRFVQTGLVTRTAYRGDPTAAWCTNSPRQAHDSRSCWPPWPPGPRQDLPGMAKPRRSPLPSSNSTWSESIVIVKMRREPVDGRRRIGAEAGADPALVALVRRGRQTKPAASTAFASPPARCRDDTHRRGPRAVGRTGDPGQCL